MLKEDFWQSMTEIGDAFGYEPKDARIEAYWKALNHIPGETWAEMVPKIIANVDRFPTIKRIKEAYAEIGPRANQEDSGAGDPNCPDCGGEGRLYIKRTYPHLRVPHFHPQSVLAAYGGLVIYESMGRCARCAADRGNQKIPAIWRGKVASNPHVLSIEPVIEEGEKKPLPKKRVTEDQLAVEFGELPEGADPGRELTEEELYKIEERKAILDEQARSLRNERETSPLPSEGAKGQDQGDPRSGE